MPRPFTLFAFAILGTLPTLSYRAKLTHGQAELTASIDSFIDRQIAADAFSGTVLVARKGQIVYQRAAGMSNREMSIPMALDTKLQIASTTKLFTQIAIRQLEQAGKL